MFAFIPLAWAAIVARIPGVVGIAGKLEGVLNPAGAVLGFGSSLLGFFSTKLGQVIAVLLVMVAVYFVADWRGRSAEGTKWQAQIEATKAADAKRDQDTKAAVSSDVDARLAAANKLNSELQDKVKVYETELKRTANSACNLSPNDIKRLRSL
jgi:hypothetical protein